MAPQTTGAVLDRAVTEDEFRLDVRVVEALTPVPALMRSTSDGCGSTCSGPCNSFVSDPDLPN